MAKNNKKEEWKQSNETFVQKLSNDPESQALGNGVYYKVVETGEGERTPELSSVVTCHYKGSLINGKVFDDSFARKCPEAFRCRDLIPGFTNALLKMHVGDHWTVYIPYTQGYGTRTSGPIPGYSTLIFEIKLLNIG